MYFRLLENIRIAKGPTRSLIFNINNGMIIQITNVMYDILTRLNNGVAIENVCDNFTLLNEKLKYFNAKGIGNFSDSFIHRDQNVNTIISNRVEMLWLKLTESCNYKCLHCYDDCHPKTIEQSISVKDYISAVKHLNDKYKVMNVQLIGGEPLLKGKKFIFELINNLKNIGISNIEIFTNCSLIDKEYLNFFANNNISIATSLYSQYPKVHDQITTVNGSHKKLVSTCKQILEQNIKLRISTTIMKENSNEINTINKWIFDNLNTKNSSFDIIRPIGRGINKKHFPEKLFNQFRVISNESVAIQGIMTYDLNRIYNPCWRDRLCIDNNGKLYPCVMSNTSFGDITDIVNLWEDDKTPRYLNNDKIPICNDCEFRYSCWDCRAMSEIQGSTSKPFYCTYNPYIGKWDNKINLENIIYE